MQQFPTQGEFQEDFDFKNSSLLGQGTFGKVYRAKALKSLPPGNYALKIIETTSEQAYELAIQELNLYQVITYHQNVIKVYKVYSWIEEKKYVLVFAMELAHNSLKADIEERRKASQEFGDIMLIDIMNQCLKAFYYLAKNKHLFHRDIKPENILVSCRQPYTVKLADFGAGKENFNGQTMLNTLVGTPLFLSPKLYVAYSTNQAGKVKHDLEKSDVFSLGITFLQMILLLSDKDLQKLNDPIIYEEKTGNAIDTSDDALKKKDCQGWKKLQFHISNIRNPLIKACIQGMTEFSERNRFTWLKAIKALNPEYEDDEKDQSVYPAQIRDEQTKAIQFYSNQCITLRYLGSVNDLSNHKKIISADSQILAYSNEGVRLISLQGVSECIFTQNVSFLSYIPTLSICVGITQSGEIFGVNVKNKTFYCEKIKNFQHDKITVMKYMRKDLCILGSQSGEIMILAFDTQPPCVIKKYKDVDRSVVDMIYDDENKQIISSHENFMIYGKQLVYEQSAKYQYDSQIDNLQLISSERFAGLCKNLSQIPIFHIKDGNMNILHKYQINGNNIPLALTLSDNYLVWVCEKYIGSIQISAKLGQQKEDNNDQLMVNASKPAKLMCFLQIDKTIIASDGLKLHKYQVGKKQQDKTVCQGCQTF
ncbi:unnamed protein product (macronuclear) [Paramecium tetraurelia]|uniref:Protein kinase domain-containing protein n=1 Tax=Paramecium tetraurelia TaxID=5888 RepID=A0CWA4_PARTE|nr:uncharacterized protein GSPATT00001273001 [Paramecium tetraurelia]CAK75071.1 unnamed protein product [Paramecium tetraurelia]|eukprot:XP_001442468.1 hypothetical protein (macronuclear) [Paramecium tetraurelia strain d4-2]